MWRHAGREPFLSVGLSRRIQLTLILFYVVFIVLYIFPEDVGQKEI